MNALRLIRLSFLSLILLGIPCRGRAEDSDFGALVTSEHAWELTLAPGYAFLVGPEYNDINYSNGMAAEGGLYYQLSQWVGLGLEGGYSFQHNTRDVFFSFEDVDYFIENRVEVARVTPEVRLGRWVETSHAWRWRPYLQAGAGWYQIFQKTNFKAADNESEFRFQLGERTDDYLGANAGIGIEFEVYPQGVIGLHAAYHRVFSNPQNFQFILPSLRFSCLF